MNLNINMGHGPQMGGPHGYGGGCGPCQGNGMGGGNQMMQMMLQMMMQMMQMAQGQMGGQQGGGGCGCCGGGGGFSPMHGAGNRFGNFGF
jgi:hypothetical protein